jgi:hypothetical protein
MMIPTHYVTLTECDRFGTYHKGDLVLNFDDACDQYVEAREDGQPAAVFRVDPPRGNAAGMYIDVTADAERRIAQWHNARRQELPEWLEVA